MLKLAYEKVNWFTAWKSVCLCNACSFGFCDKISTKSVYSAGNERTKTDFCKCMSGFWSRSCRIWRWARPCASTCQLSPKIFSFQMSEFTERSLFSTSQKQRISIYPKSPLGRKSLVTQLFCGILWRSSHFDHSSIYWKSAITSRIAPKAWFISALNGRVFSRQADKEPIRVNLNIRHWDRTF